MNNLLPVLFVTVNLILSHISSASATTVDVYAEGGYTDTVFVVDIYADIAPDAQGGLVSAGVKLSYPVTKLQNPDARKNDRAWYFGPAGGTFAYCEPDVSTIGEIVFLTGTFDPNAPLQGVQGERIHLGRVSFDRIAATDLPVQHEFSLSDGMIAPFVDFATEDGSELDGLVNFSIAPVTARATLMLRGVLRVLHVLTAQIPDVPVRAAELDLDNDGVVGIGDVLMLLQEAAE